MLKIAPLLAALLLIAGFAWQSCQLRQLRVDISATRQHLHVLQQQRIDLKQQIRMVDKPCRPKRDSFRPADLPLSPQLQKHTYTISREYGVPYNLALAIMEHESRFISDIPDHINHDGTRDRGLMQINETNWQWLAEMGLDVSVPEQNIQAGIIMLAQLTHQYGISDGLRAYAAGETGMKQGQGYWFLDELAALNPNILLY